MKELEPDTFTFLEARGELLLMRCRHGWEMVMTKESLAARKAEHHEWFLSLPYTHQTKWSKNT